MPGPRERYLPAGGVWNYFPVIPGGPRSARSSSLRSHVNARWTAGSVLAATLKATNLSRERSGHMVLNRVSLTVAPGDRIGVIGPNGVGKTTLLRTLAGLDAPDRGSVEASPPGATVGYLAQERERPHGETVEAYLRRRSGTARAELALDDAVHRLAAGDMSEDAQAVYARALERFNQVDPGSFEARAAETLAALGASGALLSAPAASLSGGEAARVGLAALMLSRYDITLLDEPTNDLDFGGLEQLEDLVLNLPGGLMVVSHDREFLARTVNAVLEIDEHTREANLYGGDWASYLQEKAALARHREEAWEKYRQTREELVDRAQRERLWATAGVARERKSAPDKDKMQRDFRVNRTEQLAARARRTEKALERLEPAEKPWAPWELRYSLQLAPRAGAVVASLAGAVVVKGSFRLGPVDLVVQWGDRVTVTGPNGSGKTTLVEALLGRAPLLAGSRALGPSAVPGELGQERSDVLALGDARGPDLLADFMRATGLAVPEARSLLAKFGLGAADVDRPIATLSPGERTRAQLACFQAVGVNFLVLDEPTNHLDLPAIEQLEAALGAYEGTLLIVSHDRRLLAGLRVTHRVEVADGKVSVTEV
jgi:ATPase subunit of ABC transporter with duplicated ATPase domains